MKLNGSFLSVLVIATLSISLLVEKVDAWKRGEGKDKPMKDMCMKILDEDECTAEEKCTWYADKEMCLKSMCIKLNEDECTADKKCTWYADKEICWKSVKPEMGNGCLKLNEDECTADKKCTWYADKEICWKSDKP